MNSDNVIGTSTICAWSVAPGLIWIQTSSPDHARRLAQRRDARLVAYGVVGGYLRTFEVPHPLSWARQFIANHTACGTPTNGPFLGPEPRQTHRKAGTVPTQVPKP